MNKKKLSRTLTYYRHKLFPRHQHSFSVAISIYIGVWIGIMPTIGIAIALTILLCKLFNLPIIPAVTASFIANPATQFPLFYPAGYWIGKNIIQPPPFEFLSILKQISEGFSFFELSSYGDSFTALTELITKNTQHFVAYLIGMTIVSTAIALVCFFAALFYMNNLKKIRKQMKEAKRLLLKGRKSL